MEENMERILNSLGWPFFAFLAFFVLIFKKQLGDFISRIISIDKSGIKTLSVPEVQREEQKKEDVQELFNTIGNPSVLRDIEKRLKMDLKNRGLEKKEDLIKLLAVVTILLSFERIHSMIFGSQIFLLKRLNEMRGKGIPKEVVLSYFKKVQELHPKLGSWSPEEYLSFLKTQALITIQENNYHITNLGGEYLTWIARNGRQEEKPL